MNYRKIPSPAYVLNSVQLQKNLELIARVGREAGVEVIPALKGFALWRVFDRIRPYVSAAAASGLYESRLIHQKFKLRAHTFSPAYHKEDFDDILSCSSHLSFNSLSQAASFLPRIKSWNRQNRKTVSPGIRVNPGYSPVTTALYNPAAPGSRLGVAPSVLLSSNLLPKFEGLHFHVLCESSAEQSCRAIDTFEQAFEKLLISGQLKWLNFGGGHLLTAESYDTDLLIRRLGNFKKKYPGICIYLEPGSAFVWQAGVLRSQVVDVVEHAGISTAILDISFTAHLPDCLEMPYQPRIVGAQIVEDPEHAAVPGFWRYRMGGNSCLAGDWLGDWDFPKQLKSGDAIIFEDMIHYTTVKTTMFNGVKHPAIGLWENNQYHHLKEFAYRDYRDRMC